MVQEYKSATLSKNYALILLATVLIASKDNLILNRFSNDCLCLHKLCPFIAGITL